MSPSSKARRSTEERRQSARRDQLALALGGETANEATQTNSTPKIVESRTPVKLNKCAQAEKRAKDAQRMHDERAELKAVADEYSPKRSDRQPGEHRRVITAFHDNFVARFDEKPIWAPRDFRLIRELLDRRSPDEIIDRTIRLLSGRGPSWIKPPWSVGTLVLHYDKLAVDSERPGRGMTPAEIIAWGQRAKDVKL